MDKKHMQGTNDRIPILDPPEIPRGPSRTEETDDEAREEREEQYNEEQGIISENELLEDSVIFDNDLAEENIENDAP